MSNVCNKVSKLNFKKRMTIGFNLYINIIIFSSIQLTVNPRNQNKNFFVRYRVNCFGFLFLLVDNSDSIRTCKMICIDFFIVLILYLKEDWYWEEHSTINLIKPWIALYIFFKSLSMSIATCGFEPRSKHLTKISSIWS